MRPEKRHGLSQLRLAVRSTGIASEEESSTCLAGASKSDELKPAPSTSLQCQDIIGVSRVSGLPLGMVKGGLETNGARAAKSEVVRNRPCRVRRANRIGLRHTKGHQRTENNHCAHGEATKPAGILHTFLLRRSSLSVRNPSKRSRARRPFRPDLEFTIAPYRDNLTAR